MKYSYGNSPQGSLVESTMASGSPFDAVSRTYDSTFSASAIGRAQRNSVWREMNRTFQKGHRILEINCGTGIDALHLAGRGVQVVACDSAPGMIAVARQRLDASSNRALVDLRCLATEQIAQLESEGPYDGILSNFSGLNCLSDLTSVARDLACLVKPGGKAIVCVFGRFCLWEISWYLAHGNFQKAFRRLRRKGVEATLAPWVNGPGELWFHKGSQAKFLALVSSGELEWRGCRGAALVSRSSGGPLPAALSPCGEHRSAAWSMPGISFPGRSRGADF